MLKRVISGKQRHAGGSVAIVASKYNGRYVDAMLRAAVAELKLARVTNVKVVRVPGAFEIPTVVAELAHTSRIKSQGFSAIICLGVIFQGQTSHAQHIGWGVTRALAHIQVQYRIPVIHGVFLFESEAQARVRCLGRKHNRGREAAQTALEMARVMANLQPPP